MFIWQLLKNCMTQCDQERVKSSFRSKILSRMWSSKEESIFARHVRFNLALRRNFRKTIVWCSLQGKRSESVSRDETDNFPFDGIRSRCDSWKLHRPCLFFVRHPSKCQCLWQERKRNILLLTKKRRKIYVLN